MTGKFWMQVLAKIVDVIMHVVLLVLLIPVAIVMSFTIPSTDDFDEENDA